ncbi:MAG: hypothetical protein IT447_16710 [Phycisphaerales bacterium]|nr:hypothetical protein [Phycisphaerales bacterium]
MTQGSQLKTNLIPRRLRSRGEEVIALRTLLNARPSDQVTIAHARPFNPSRYLKMVRDACGREGRS